MNVKKLLRLSMVGSLLATVVLLTGCASTPQKQAEIQRISPEELDRIMPKPVPTITLDDLVNLSKITPPDELIVQIKASNSQYDLTPSQTLELSKKGVDAKVLDYIHQAREQSVRDSVADEINRREAQKKQEQQQIIREYQSRYYYDPWWGYGGGYRPWGPSFYYGPSYRRHW